MNQLALPLDWPAAEGPGEFVVGTPNALAARHLEHVATWPVMTSVLIGPRKSGRSLLGRIFAHRSGGLVIDGADHSDGEALFHAWNAAQARRRPLLLIADAPPSDWSIALPDLRSRLAASPVVAIEEPDEAMIEALLALLLARRGLDAPSALTQWIAVRIERSYVAVLRTIDVLDGASLSRRRRLSVPLARAVLAEAGMVAVANGAAA